MRIVSRHGTTSSLLGIPLLGILAFGACDCGGSGFNRLPDAGKEPEEDAGSEPEPDPPPIFPMKKGDQVDVSRLGMRNESPSCAVAGDCERVLRATYTIDADPKLDKDTNRWVIKAHWLYDLEKDTTDNDAVSRLFISRVAPFADLNGAGDRQSSTDDDPDADPSDFRSDAAPIDSIDPLGFPFFHWDPAYEGCTQTDAEERAECEEEAAGRPFRAAQAAFEARIQQLDPELVPAEAFSNQASVGKLEAYFRDDLGAQVMLHMVRVEMHPFGFMCTWDERMVPWVDGMARSINSFQGVTPPLVSQVHDVAVNRDLQRYTCSCFNKDCRRFDNASGTNVCLNPADPDDDAAAEFCN